MVGILKFLKYNNTVPIVISVVLLGAGSTYAANNPEVILDRQQRVVSVDNTYIVSKDLENYTPTLKILLVEEDDDTYYITYEFTTIALHESIWRDVTTTEIMEVKKRRLDRYRDLGMFVTEQLSELVDTEIRRLQETQVIEEKNLSQKRVVTAYSGLVGGLLSDKQETVPGYRPLVVPPKPKPEPETFAYPPALDEILQKEKADKEEELVETTVVEEEVVEETEGAEEGVDDNVDTASTSAGSNETDSTETNQDKAPSTGTDATASSSDDGTAGGGGSGQENKPPANERPVITILGDNPAEVAIGANYVDLGAVVSDDKDANLNVSILLNDSQVETVLIDTRATGTHTITYYVTDSGNLTSYAERQVIVVGSAGVPEAETGSEGDQSGGEAEENKATTTRETPVTDLGTESTTQTEAENDVDEENSPTENQEAAAVASGNQPTADRDTDAGRSSASSGVETPPPVEEDTDDETGADPVGDSTETTAPNQE